MFGSNNWNVNIGTREALKDKNNNKNLVIVSEYICNNKKKTCARRGRERERGTRVQTKSHS